MTPLVEKLKPCPFCGDQMMWLEDAVAFTHSQQTIETTLCRLSNSIIDGDRLEWWNTRTAIESSSHITDDRIETLENRILVWEQFGEAANARIEALSHIREALERIAALEPETAWGFPDRYSGERPTYKTLDYAEVMEIARAALSEAGQAVAG